MTALLDALRATLGAAHVLTDGDLSAWEAGLAPPLARQGAGRGAPGQHRRGGGRGAACAAARHRLVPQGGNTGLVGGGVPDDSGTQVLLSLQRLNRVRAIDAANLTLTAEAGCVLQAVQEAAQRPRPAAAAEPGRRRQLHHRRQPGHQCRRHPGAALGQCARTVPGPGGRHRRRARSGTGLSGLRKDNTGYDLRDLFIGSEGTLGIITAATLKLAPQPAATTTALAACATLQDCVACCARARPAGRGPDRLRGDGRVCAGTGGAALPALPRPLPDAPWTVLLEHSDTEGEAHSRERFEAVLGAALEAGLISDAVVAENLAQSARAVACARVDPAGPGRRRPEHQARHLGAGVGDSRPS
jgi:FAD/FMN-containing dehydrogenase